MRVIPWPVLFTVALMALVGASPSHAESRSSPRFWLEAGPSFDRTAHVLGDRNGYAFAGGIEMGRKFGAMLSVGHERYSGEIAPYLLQTGQVPPTVRIEGDVAKAAYTASVGLRFSVPLGVLDGFVEGAFGSFTIMQRSVRWVDPTTGVSVAGGDVRGSSSVLSEIGIGLRTRRNARFDWTLGMRLRQHAQFEGESGKSVQLRFGVVTR